MSDQSIHAHANEQGVEYRDIPEFPGYRVGDDGSVWTCRKPGAGYGTFGSWKQLKPTTTDRGRLVVKLARDKKYYPRQIHALVLLAFVGPYPPCMECCHEDGDHTNNRLSNLRYDTHVANEADKKRHGRALLGDRHPVAKLDEDKVRQIRALLTVGDKPNLSAIARRFGVDAAVVARIRDGEAWKWVV